MDKRYDMFVNTWSGFGGSYDPLNRFNFNSGTQITQAIIEDLYRYDWLSRRIIDLYAEESIKNWISITIESDDDKKITRALQSKIDELNFKSKLVELIKLGRAYGGSIMLLGGLDNGDQEDELNEGAIQKIMSLNCLDRWQLNISERYSDPFKSNYSEAKFYNLSLLSGSDDNIFKIHESRVLQFDGSFLPEKLRVTNNYWHDSELQPIYEMLKYFSIATHSGALLFHDFITKVLKIPNVADLMSTKEGRAAIQTRVQYAISSMSSVGISIVAEKEEFNKVQTPITGFTDLIKIYIDMVSSAAKIPSAILFGQSLGTLAGANETTRAWYDNISDYQENKIRPIIERFIKIIFLSKDFVTNGNEPENWSFKFNPLWQPTDNEILDVRKKQAEIDAIYMDRDVYSSLTVAKSRFGSNEYSYETNIDIEEEEEFKNNEKDILIEQLQEQIFNMKNKKQQENNEKNIIGNKKQEIENEFKKTKK